MDQRKAGHRTAARVGAWLVACATAGAANGISPDAGMLGCAAAAVTAKARAVAVRWMRDFISSSLLALGEGLIAPRWRPASLSQWGFVVPRCVHPAAGQSAIQNGAQAA